MQDYLVGSEPLQWFSDRNSLLDPGRALQGRDLVKSAVYRFSSCLPRILNYCNLGLHKIRFSQQYHSDCSITVPPSAGSFMLHCLWAMFRLAVICATSQTNFITESAFLMNSLHFVYVLIFKNVLCTSSSKEAWLL